MTSNGYWLASWLDENGIRSQRDARRFLKDPKHIEDFLATTSAIHPGAEALDGTDVTTIVAGTTIDLSGELGCYHHECLQKDVDRLFSRAWHYFDIIIVEGLTPIRAHSLFANGYDDNSLERFLAFVENYFYVRNIGAEDMLIYRQKPHACAVHLRQPAEQYGATSLLEEREAWVDSFSLEAEVTGLEQHEDHWHYVVIHPAIEHIALGAIHLENGAKREPSKSEIYGAVFDRYAAVLVSDIGAARSLHAPLGAAARIHEKLLSEASSDAPTVQDALFSLELPIISGLAAKDLIKIRQINWQYFDAFQLALRNAAREYVSNAADGTRPVDIASQIQSDIIEPELIRIRRELRASTDTLTGKSAVSLPLGSLATTIGLLDKIPLVVGSAAAVAAAGIGSFLIDYKKYLDDKRGVLTSDMYFLWKAQRIAEHKQRRPG
jgi:hypothetical protein